MVLNYLENSLEVSKSFINFLVSPDLLFSDFSLKSSLLKNSLYVDCPFLFFFRTTILHKEYIPLFLSIFLTAHLCFAYYFHFSSTLVCRPIIKSTRWRVGWVGRRLQPISMGSIICRTAGNHTWGRDVQGQVRFPSRLPKHATYHDFHHWYVAPKRISRWQGVHLHPPSTWCWSSQPNGAGRRALAAYTWSRADHNFGHIYAVWSKRLVARQHRRSSDVEKRQDCIQTKS